jgi:hypothetical protein
MAPIAQVATLSVPASLSTAQTLTPVAQVATLSAPVSLRAAQVVQPVAQVATLSAVVGLSAAQVMPAITQVALFEVFTPVADSNATIRLTAHGDLDYGARWPDSGVRGLVVCTVDVGAYAGSATIVSASVIADPAGLTVGTPTWSGAAVSVRVTGGKADVRYLLGFSVGLSDGRAVSVDGLIYRS